MANMKAALAQCVSAETGCAHSVSWCHCASIVAPVWLAVGQPEEHMRVCCQPGIRPCSGNLRVGGPRGPEPTGQPLPLFRFRVRANVLSRRHCQSQPSQLFCLAGHRERPAETYNWLQTPFWPKCLWWANLFYNLKNSVINEREGESWVWANTGIKKAHSSGNINGSFVYK